MFNTQLILAPDSCAANELATTDCENRVLLDDGSRQIHTSAIRSAPMLRFVTDASGQNKINNRMPIFG